MNNTIFPALASTVAQTSATAAYRTLLNRILIYGRSTTPRGRATLEVAHSVVAFPLARYVVVSPARKPSYRFLSAEPLWILSGSDRVDKIAPYNKRMREFSDDGETLWGAYGPRVMAQLPYVVDALVADRDSRQAVMSLWRGDPRAYVGGPPSRDVPCTLSLVFSIRADRLHVFATMRSSDAWLGVPYDFATFAVVGLCVACAYNRLRNKALWHVLPGALVFAAHSSHLYAERIDGARAVAAEDDMTSEPDPVPDAAVVAGEWGWFDDRLRAARDAGRPPRFGPTSES